jgi:hypothetical protein
MILLLVGSSHAQLDVPHTSSLHKFGIFQQPARGLFGSVTNSGAFTLTRQ